MHKRDIFGYLALLFMALAGLAGTYYTAWAPYQFRIAVPPAESEPAQVFHALSSALRRDRARVRLTVISYDNNEAIVQALATRKVDLAVARADRPLPRASLGVAEVHQFIALVLARPESGIESFADLKGRAVGEITRSEPMADVFSEIAAFSKIEPGDLKITPIRAPGTLAAAIAEHKLDAILMVAPRGSRLLGAELQAAEAGFGAPPVIIALKEAAAIATRNPAFEAGEIVAGELASNPPAPAATVPTITFPALLMARNDLSSAAVQELTRSLFDARNTLIAQLPAAARLAALDTERGGAFAVHPGAAVYYDASETSFLDRYSDWMWLVLFGFSTVVSAAVWFMRRLFPQQREILRADHLELVELLREVRATRETDILDKAQARVDEVVAYLSKLSFDGKIDEEQQPAFDLIINRIEKAIEDRRAALARN